MGFIYFVNPGRKNEVMVQIGTGGEATIYYSRIGSKPEPC